MPYKTCHDFSNISLKQDDKLEFQIKFGNDNTDIVSGSFVVSQLPNENGSVMLLVAHRYDQFSTAISFQSHFFAKLQNAQIAIIDTYRGNLQPGLLRLQDMDAELEEEKEIEKLKKR